MNTAPTLDFQTKLHWKSNQNDTFFSYHTMFATSHFAHLYIQSTVWLNLVNQLFFHHFFFAQIQSCLSAGGKNKRSLMSAGSINLLTQFHGNYQAALSCFHLGRQTDWLAFLSSFCTITHNYMFVKPLSKVCVCVCACAHFIPPNHLCIPSLSSWNPGNNVSSRCGGGGELILEASLTREARPSQPVQCANTRTHMHPHAPTSLFKVFCPYATAANRSLSHCRENVNVINNIRSTRGLGIVHAASQSWLKHWEIIEPLLTLLVTPSLLRLWEIQYSSEWIGKLSHKTQKEMCNLFHWTERRSVCVCLKCTLL